MRLKDSFFYTIREDIKDEESKSGKLLVRSGMVKKAGNGIYMYLPLGLKVKNNIENIIREEMNNTGALELTMPCMIPEEVYINSGRRANFGDSMFGFKDRYKRDYVLGPTHEELFAVAASMKIKSYKDMPFNLYQIGTKYRDEPRPRFGLIRVREFTMKDAYSFDIDEAGLDIAYQKMFNAYKKIFDRMEIDYKIVKADTGSMGGSLSEEFQAVTEIGEDTLVLCHKCDYASNIEVSASIPNTNIENEEKLEKQLVETPNAGTIEDVTNYMGLSASKFVKTLIYKVNNHFYAVLVPGNRDVNEVKLSKLLGVSEVALAEPDDVERITQAKVGFAGPLEIGIPIIMDNNINNMFNFVVGANKTDYHYKNVNISDFKANIIGDIINIKEGDKCPKCGQPLYFKKGIEIGNTFKLGTKYSESLGLNYLDQNNQLHPVVMGSYGIGSGRVMAAVVEQKSDDKGIIWPYNIAPYKVGIVLIDVHNEEQAKIADYLYNELNRMGIETILDNRELSAGVKFNDMDLIGLPVRLVVGNKTSDNMVEFKLRSTNESEDLKIEQVIEKIKSLS
ncbi:MAG: proline--tRNA ligase [Bacilli bacterium]|nr:proline--tRNA ligase [Bacilli bacterium]MDD4809001.1 proline--tRNA ligase [Bacilli bacterium]